MEKRRLIKFGKNSYVISLPKGWVTANRLTKGSELLIEEKPSSVIVSASTAEQQERTVRIDCNNKDLHAIHTELTSYYNAGYTTIIITGDHLADFITTIKDDVLNLSGVEIVEQSLNRIVVKDLIDIRQIALPTLINRMDIMLRSMFQDILSAEGVPPEAIRDRDRDLNRIQFLVARVVRNLLENPAIGNLIQATLVEAYCLEKVAWALERIGDYLKRFNDDVHRVEPKVEERLRQHLRGIYDRYLEVMKTYYHHAPRKAATLYPELLNGINEYTTIVRSAENRDEVLALENVKNILRDLRIVTRATIEMVEQPHESA